MNQLIFASEGEPSSPVDIDICLLLLLALLLARDGRNLFHSQITRFTPLRTRDKMLTGLVFLVGIAAPSLAAGAPPSNLDLSETAPTIMNTYKAWANATCYA